MKNIIKTVSLTILCLGVYAGTSHAEVDCTGDVRNSNNIVSVRSSDNKTLSVEFLEKDTHIPVQAERVLKVVKEQKNQFQVITASRVYYGPSSNIMHPLADVATLSITPNGANSTLQLSLESDWGTTYTYRYSLNCKK